MDVQAQIANLIEPSLIDMGYDLVRVKFLSGRGATLQIMAERRDEEEMTVDDCAAISHTVSALLDVADPIKTPYQLEVSSPGMDRPLTRLSDYERFVDYSIKLDLITPKDGRKRFSGIVRGASGDMIRLEVAKELIELPFADIASAKLEVTEEMLREAMRRQSASENTPDKKNPKQEPKEVS